jgi:serine/threonine protein kinase
MDQYIGKSLDRYQIQSLIGEGGMGSVYRAHDPRLDRDIAIKLMHPFLSRQPNFQERFLKEARAAARLNHPGIVKVHDSGQSGEALYIVMEYLHGDNLKQLLNRMKNSQQWLSCTEAAHLIRQICYAVEYSHQHGVFFRDIKPDNIMFKDEQVEDLPYRPVLTDLGLAKLADEIPITREGESMGTPSYMSPEQALGKPTDARSDLYSLGILFFELATGELPFEVKSLAEAIHAHTKMPPPSPRFLNPDIPTAIEDILLKSLQKDPARRFQTATEMADAIATAIPPKNQALTTGADTQEQQFTLMTQYQSSLVGENAPSLLHPTITPPDDLPYDRIQILSRGHTARFVYIRGGTVTIGRAEDNDVVLPDMNVSQHHARVEYDGKNYSIVDLKSTNGVFQDGAKLLPGLAVIWQTGKLVQIGDYWLQLDLAQKTYVRLPAKKEEDMGIATIVDAGEALNPLPESPGMVFQQAMTETFEKVPATSENKGTPPLQPVQANFDIEVVPPRQMNVVEGRFSVYLRNQGSDTISVNLEGYSPDENLKFTFDRTQVDLPVEDGLGRTEVTLSIGLKSPMGGDQPYYHTFTIRAYPNNASENPRTLMAEWIQTVPDIHIQLRPAGKADDHKIFNIDLQNNSTEDLTVQLLASDSQNALSYEIQTQQSRLKAGEKTIVPMRVAPGKPIYSEPKTPYKFMVSVKVLEAPAYKKQLQGEWGKIGPGASTLGQKFLAPPYLWAWILMILGWTASPILFDLVGRFICADCVRNWAYSVGMGEGGGDLLLILFFILFVSFISGLMTGISLRKANSSISIGAILIILLTWVFSISGIITCSFELFLSATWFLSFIQGAVGGLITGLVLMRTRLYPIRLIQALTIMIAWGITRGFGVWILDRFGGYFLGKVSQEVFLGALSAIVAGGWTLFEMYRSQSRAQALQP